MPRLAPKAQKPESDTLTLSALDARNSASPEADVARLVENGLPLAIVDELIDLGFTRKEVHAMVIPQRTLTHRKNRRESLTADESDKVLRLARAVAFAEEVFGTRENAWLWLREPSPALEERTPLELLATEAGARAVEGELVAIDEGMFL